MIPSRGPGRRAPTGAAQPPRTLYVTKEHIMSEAEEFTRRALQESMDLRDQGHSDD